MTSEVNEENKPGGGCLLGNWVEERSTAFLDKSRPKSCVHKHGHTGIFTMDEAAKVQGISTFKAAFNAPANIGMRQKGRRIELLENELIKRISDEIHTDLKADHSLTDLCSVTKTDYKGKSFQSVRAPLTMESACLFQNQEYTSEQAITFWTDNYQKIQGVTAVKTMDSPFKRNATFSTPIGQQLDQVDETLPSPRESDAHLLGI